MSEQRFGGKRRNRATVNTASRRKQRRHRGGGRFRKPLVLTDVNKKNNSKKRKRSQSTNEQYEPQIQKRKLNSSNSNPHSFDLPRRRSKRIQKNKNQQLNIKQFIDLSNDVSSGDDDIIINDNMNNKNNHNKNRPIYVEQDDYEQDDDDDVELIQTPILQTNNKNDNNDNKVNYNGFDEFDDTEIDLYGVAIGRHYHFWYRDSKYWDRQPKLVLNQYERSIEIYFKRNSSDDYININIRMKEIKSIYFPHDPCFHDIDELSLNKHNLKEAQKEKNGAPITSSFAVLFIQTKQQLKAYKWLEEYYDPTDMTDVAASRITLILDIDEFSKKLKPSILNKHWSHELIKCIEYIENDEKTMWIKCIRFKRAVTKKWKEIDTQKTRKHINKILVPDCSHDDDDDDDKDVDEPEDSEEKEIDNNMKPRSFTNANINETIDSLEQIDITKNDSNEMNMTPIIDPKHGHSNDYAEYIENTDFEQNPHHENSRLYVLSRSDKPPKGIVCYWVFPKQHDHKQVINHIETKDFEKVLIDDEYLNDTIIDFQLKYTYSSWPSLFKHKVYVFNSFFWRKLLKIKNDKTTTSKDELQLLKWTKTFKSIFEKDYILIPKCHHLHWELVIICYAGKVFKTFNQEQHDDDEYDADPFDKGNDDDDIEITDIEEKKKAPCIVILDSLNNSRKGTEFKLIRKWLNLQANDYLNKNENSNGNFEEIEEIFTTKTMPGYCIATPLQPNGHDCGCFLLRNALQFGKDEGFEDTSSKAKLNKSQWYDAEKDGVGYRKEIRKTLKILINQQKDPIQHLINRWKQKKIEKMREQRK